MDCGCGMKSAESKTKGVVKRKMKDMAEGKKEEGGKICSCGSGKNIKDCCGSA